MSSRKMVAGRVGKSRENWEKVEKKTHERSAAHWGRKLME